MQSTVALCANTVALHQTAAHFATRSEARVAKMQQEKQQPFTDSSSPPTPTLDQPPPYPPTASTQYVYQPQSKAYAANEPISFQYDQSRPNTQVQAGMIYPTPLKATVSVGGYGSTDKLAASDDGHTARRRHASFDSHHAFGEKTVRLAFVRKLYSIFLMQLLLAAGVVCLFLFVSPLRRYCQWHPWPTIASL